MGTFWTKYIMFELKKYRVVMFYYTEDWCKIWRKTDMWFGKWHDEFGKFLPEHLKVSKLGLCWDPFNQSRKWMNLKFTEEFCIIIMKNDAKLKKSWHVISNLTPQFWPEFWPKRSNIYKIRTLMGSFWPKYIMFELRKYGRVMFDGTAKIDAKFKR